jgi:O-6-methylguanine DNA methyltransferase
MQCRNALTRIDAMRTGELPDSEVHAVHDHLRKCPSCDESVADVTQLARAAKGLRVETPRSCRSQFCDHLDMLDVAGQKVWVAFSDRGLTMIYAGGSEDEFRHRYCAHAGRDLSRAELPPRLREQVVGALEGRGVEKPKVDLSDLTEFERNVLEILTRIPRGEVRSYAWVARQAGRPSAVRAVGNICAKNVVPFVVPCHRVVPTTGGVGNYAFGTPVKRALLEREGVPLDELDDLARQRIRFVASKTTKIFCNPTCRDARRIQDKNRVPLHDKSEAARKGFRPCKRCQPIAA